MSSDSAAALRAIFDETMAAHRRFAGQGLPAVAAAAAAIGHALAAGRKVLAFGNGGSASDAEHISSPSSWEGLSASGKVLRGLP